MKCWGANSQGQAFSSLPSAAVGTVPWELGAALKAEPLGQAATRVLAGAWHTCAILANRSSKCWGSGA